MSTLFVIDIAVKCIVCVAVASIILGVVCIIDIASKRRKPMMTDIELDVAIVGPPCSGKTTLFELLMNNKFTPTYSTTLDKEIGTIEIVFVKSEPNGNVREIKVRMHLWSLAGQDNIKAAKNRRSYLRGMDAICFVADVSNVAARSKIGQGVEMYLKYAMKSPDSPPPVTAIILNKSDLIAEEDGTKKPLTAALVSRSMYRVSRLPEWIPRKQCKSFLTSFKYGESRTEEEKSGYFGSTIGSKTDIVHSGDVCETLLSWLVNRHLNTRPGEELRFVKKL